MSEPISTESWTRDIYLFVKMRKLLGYQNATTKQRLAVKSVVNLQWIGWFHVEKPPVSDVKNWDDSNIFQQPVRMAFNR
jgi:hypothetical protein